MITLELEESDYKEAVDFALARYRQRSNNAVEESFLFLDVQPEVQTYTLPPEVQEVRGLYRQNILGAVGGGAQIDPFSLGWQNYLMAGISPSNMGGGGSGNLAVYDSAQQFLSLAGRMFGRDLAYVWNAASKKLLFKRRFYTIEQVAVHIYNTRPEEQLFIDPYALPWLRDYSVAQCKLFLGEGRGKYQSLGGPQGAVNLNGEAMKTEATAEMERLEKEIDMLVDSHEGWPFSRC
jgi:hypothetical protein